MTLEALPDLLRDAGVNVRTLDGWQYPHTVLSGSVPQPYVWADGHPYGHMHHHTATISYLPNRDKANGYAGLSTASDNRLYQGGTGEPVYVIANAYPAPISSGYGRRELLDDYVRQDRQFIGRQIVSDDYPKWAGNRYYWNTEWVLDGIGSPTDPAVWDMMLTVCDVIDRLMGWSPYRNVGHGQHTNRKIDLRDGRFPDMAATILQLQEDLAERRRTVWAEDITDYTWMAMFHSGVPGVQGFGRYYCKDDGTYNFLSGELDVSAPWGSNPHPSAPDGGAGYSEKVNALNYLFAGFAKAAGGGR